MVNNFIIDMQNVYAYTYMMYFFLCTFLQQFPTYVFIGPQAIGSGRFYASEKPFYPGMVQSDGESLKMSCTGPTKYKLTGFMKSLHVQADQRFI